MVVDPLNYTSYHLPSPSPTLLTNRKTTPSALNAIRFLILSKTPQRVYGVY